MTLLEPCSARWQKKWLVVVQPLLNSCFSHDECCINSVATQSCWYYINSTDLRDRNRYLLDQAETVSGTECPDCSGSEPNVNIIIRIGGQAYRHRQAQGSVSFPLHYVTSPTLHKHNHTNVFIHMDRFSSLKHTAMSETNMCFSTYN